MPLKLVLIACTLTLIASASAADWQTISKTDPITDEKLNYAFVEDVRNNEVFGSLVVRCDGSWPLNVYLVGKFFGENRHGNTVTYRIDKQEPFTRNWLVSRDGTALFANDAFKKKLANQLRVGEKVVIRATDYRGVTTDYFFTLAGSNDAIGTVLSNCDP